MRSLYLAIVASLMVPVVAFAATTMPYRNIPTDAYYYQPVLKALELGIIGREEGELVVINERIVPGLYDWDAGKPLNRWVFVYYMLKTINADLVTPETPSFSDVPKINDGYGYGMYPYVETAKKLGLVSGTQTADGKPTGKFEPFKLVNRAEAAVIIMKAFMQVKAGSVTFPDLQNAPWAVDAINRAATVGFFSGYPDKTFGPGNNINKAEGITVLMQVHKKLESKELTLSFATAKIYTASELLKKAETAMPGSILVNIQQRGNYLFFFAHTPQPDSESYVWYVMSLIDSGARPIRIFEYRCDLGVVCPYGVDLGAPTADGTEFVLVDIELVNVKIPTMERTSLGSVLSEGTKGQVKYRYPFFTSDDRYFIMQDVIDGKLVVLDSKTKTTTAIDGFPFAVQVGLKLEHAKNYSFYKELDANRIQFGSLGILNLSTMTKE